MLIDGYDEVAARLSSYEDDRNQIISNGKRGFLLSEASGAVADEGDD